jgi:hypothetical protein
MVINQMIEPIFVVTNGQANGNNESCEIKRYLLELTNGTPWIVENELLSPPMVCNTKYLHVTLYILVNI